MTSIKLEVTGAKAWATVTGPLTSGMVGIPVTIEYDETWEGLTKNLVCRCGLKDSDGGETRTILNVDKTAVVAHEVMQAGQYLYLGVEGFREDGTLVMPTTWARSENLIQHGSDSDADPSVDPSLPVWGQLQAQIDQINREGISPEQMEEIRACAKSAAQSEENAGISASSAAYLVKAAETAQTAAESAAGRAEAAAESLQNVDYTVLTSKPSINGVTLEGNKTSAELGIGQPSDEQVGAAVGEWLEEHPEATTVVADRSITPAKTTFIEPVVQNLIDISKMVKGGIAEATGEIGTTAGYTSDYIPVEPGKTYRCNVGFGTGGNWTSYYYDGDKSPVSIVEGNPFTVPEGAAYVRLSWYFNDDPLTKQYALFEGVNTWPFSQGAQRYELDAMLTAAIERIADAYTAVKAVPKNLYKRIGYGGVDSSTGSIGASGTDGMPVTDYIEITTGMPYTTNCLSSAKWTAFYDADKQYVCSFDDGAEILKNDGHFATFRVMDPTIRYIVNCTSKVLQNPISTHFFVRGDVVPDSLEGVDIAVPSTDMIDALKKLLGVTGNDLAGLTWAVLGDSITAAPGLERNYHGIVADKLGLTAIGYGYSGSWVSYTEQMDGVEMCTRYDAMTDSADIVTCFGGINDINNGAALGQMGDTEKTTFYGAMDILIQGLLRKYPGKRIGFITPLRYGDGTKEEPYIDAIHDVCEKYAVPVLDLYREGMISTATEELSATYFKDGLHPNELGHDVMARKVEAFLKRL